MRPGLISIALALLVAGNVASSSQASSFMKVGVVDDGLMMRSPGVADQTAREWHDHGVDQSRLTLIWERIAPDAASTRKPVGFDARNPDSPGYDWSETDAAISALSRRGIAITLSITTPGPVWASSVPSRRESTYRPKAAEFAEFVHAVALRYGSRVSTYALINEPNLWQRLTPQWSCSGTSPSTCSAASPAIYRELFRAGYTEIKSISPKSVVWVGSLAPFGNSVRSESHAAMAPLIFLRRLGCVQDDYSRDRSSSDCRSFKPITADAIAHHPHSGSSSPSTIFGDDDSVSIATLDRLTSSIDRIQSRGGLLNGTATGAARSRNRLDVYVDEYGVQTNPPDAWSGVSLQSQDAYYQQAAYMMWKNPRVKLYAQYLWKDERSDAATIGAGSWQSGVYFANGAPKPSASSFERPFWVDLPRGSHSALIWGQVRPGAASRVQIQARLSSAARFTPVREVTTNAAGYFALRLTVRQATSFRFGYGASFAKVSSTRAVKPR